MLGMDLSTGVDGVVEKIEKLPIDLFAETLQSILVHLQDQNRAVDLIETCDKFQRAGINLDQKTVQDIIRLMSYYFRLAAKSNLSADVLVSKLTESNSNWSKPTLQLVHQLWTEHASLLHAHQEVLTMASIGHLVDIQWKLGMAVSSDTCRSLNSPFISVLMKIADTSGEMSYKSFEMTVQQFQNFYRQFKEMASVLETV
ncbi:COMM domain-containing protein 6-like [Sinocyclocheilus rhinocerous]|uniref:COMM domain-containing protein 6-like n=1 Tax=Sinocyclocheilus rhinocerous TaxID=307959 RepID=UPI0007B7D0D7|nr:PREDICTED: COMM domain-containing protein 6-like [Sinocyclocheilus rhinocerous]